MSGVSFHQFEVLFCWTKMVPSVSSRTTPTLNCGGVKIGIHCWELATPDQASNTTTITANSWKSFFPGPLAFMCNCFIGISLFALVYACFLAHFLRPELGLPLQKR